MPVLQGGAYPASYSGLGVLQAGTVTLTVTAPDGTITAPAVSLSGSLASATVPAVQVGSYLLVWTVTGALQDACSDQFSCLAPSLDLLPLGDLRDELNIAPTDHSHDVKLRRWLQAATFVVENITGPLRPLARTDTFDGEVTNIVLPYRWVRSISNLTEYRGITPYVLTEQPLGQTIDSFGYTWDRNTNRIDRRAYGGAIALFAPGIDVISCSYTLGMAAIPEDIQIATAALIKHWYEGNEVGYRSPFGPAGADPSAAAVGNYMVPRRVLELLTPWARRPGIF